MEKTFLEFFAGIGLVRVGLEKQGWKCVFANDNDPEKTRIYASNFGTGSINDKSVKVLKAEDVPTATLATASFPCQDLSEAGPQKGINGSRSRVFWDFVRILRGMGKSKPPLILLENVRGFLTAKHGENIILAVRALNDLWYSCDVLMINAQYFVPQSRPRIFVVGVLGNVAKGLDFNIDRIRKHEFRTEQIRKLMKDNPDLKWFDVEIPPPPQNATKLEQILDPVEKVPKSYWFDEAEVERHEKMIPTHHKEKIDSLIKNGGKAAFTMYRRMRKGAQKAELRFDGIAGCLRTAKGGSAKQFLVIVENGKLRMRKPTIAELRRLMGVPPSFYLPDEYIKVYSALGDAVVVPAIEWVAQNLLNSLTERL